MWDAIGKFFSQLKPGQFGSLLIICVGAVFYWAGNLDQASSPIFSISLKTIGSVVGCIGAFILIWHAWKSKANLQDGTSRPPLIDRWKPESRSITYEQNKNCDVYHDFSRKEYSELTAQACKQQDRKSIFTVLRIEPKYFVDEILRLAKAKNYGITDIADISEDICHKIIDPEYPHFTEFDSFAKQHPTDIIRLVLKPRSDSSWKERNDGKVMRVFSWINGAVPCYVVDLENADFLSYEINFLTDHVIFDGNACFDYYPESSTLILSEGKLPRSIVCHQQSFLKEQDHIWVPLSKYFT